MGTSRMQRVCVLVGLVAVTLAANPDAPRRGIKNLGQTIDCSGAVAFSATATPKSKDGKGRNQMIEFETSLIDKAAGYSRESGVFTTHCPGLYQISFTGTCDDCRFSLRKRPSSATTSWNSIVSTGKTGGSHLVLLDMEVGEQAAVFLDSGTMSTSTSHSFSGLRVSKK